MDVGIEARTRGLWEVFNDREPDALEEITAAGFVNRNALPGTPVGPEGHRQVFERLWAAIPDACFEIERLAADGDTAICVGTMSGTHAGRLLGVEATGAKFEWRQCHLYRFDADGLIVEHDAIRDDAGLFRQFGEGA